MPMVPVTERLYISPITLIDEWHRLPKISVYTDPGRKENVGTPDEVECGLVVTAIISNTGPGKCVVRAWASDWSRVEADPELVRIMPSVENPEFLKNLDQILTTQQIAALATTLQAEAGISPVQVAGGKKLVDVMDLVGRAFWPTWTGSFRQTLDTKYRELSTEAKQIEP